MALYCIFILSSLAQAFDDKANGLACEYKAEREDILQRHSQTVKDLDSYNDLQHQKHEAAGTKCIQDHEQKREITRNQNSELVDTLSK